MNDTEEYGPLTRETNASSAPPSAFGRFRVVHQVGAGVLGPVFRGYDPDSDRTVAIKSFPLDLTPEQSSDFADSLKRLAGLDLDHPSLIVPVAAGVEGSTAYLVEEYFAADSIDIAIRQYGPAPVPDAVRLIGQLAGALDFAAAVGEHHGALHPRDILVAPREVRATGVGVAAALERAGFHAPARRPYSAPERAEGGAPTVASDVYSLAVVAYELLTGRRPTAAGDELQVDVQSIPAAEPAALAEVFARALSVRPEDRHSGALAFAAALKHALTSQPIEAAAEPERRGRRGGKAAAAGNVLPLAPEAVSTGEAPARPAEPRRRRPKSEITGGAAAPLSATEGPAEAAPPDTAATPAPLSAAEGPAEAGPPGIPATPAPLSAAEGPAEVAPSDVAPASDPDILREALLMAEPELPAPPPVALDDLDVRGEPADAFELRPPSAEEGPSEARPVDYTAPPRGRVTPPVAPPATAPDQPLRYPPPSPHRFEATVPRKRRVSGLVLWLMLVLGVLFGLAAGYYFTQRSASGAPEETPVGAAGQAPAETSPTPMPPPLEPQIGSGPPALTETPAPAGSTAPSASPGAAASAPAAGAAANPAGTSTPDAASEGSRAPRATAKTPKRVPPSGTRPAEKAGPSADSRAAKARAVRGKTATAAGAERTARPVFEGQLSIVSRPSGARVFLDGHAVGTTPLTLSKVGAGSHVVRLEKDGYTAWSSSVQVVAGEPNRVTGSLDQRR